MQPGAATLRFLEPPPRTTHEASARLAQLDAIGRLYSRVLSLHKERERLLNAEAESTLLPVASAPLPVEAMPATSLQLREALRRDGCHLSTGCSLLRPLPADGMADNEDALTRLAQIDAAINALSVIAAAEAAASPQGSASASTTLVAAGPAAAVPASLLVHLASDAELGHYASLATPVVRRAFGFADKCGGSELTHDSAGAMAEALPLGTTVMRPYLALPTRKRLREGHNEAAASACSWVSASASTSATAPLCLRLPMGALGAQCAPRLLDGDVLHVPFSAAEAALLVRAMAQHGLDSSSAVPSANPSGESPPRHLVVSLASLLPGRTPADCWRFWHSGELSATLEASAARAGAGAAVAAAAAAVAGSSAAGPSASAAPCAPDASSDRLWLLRLGTTAAGSGGLTADDASAAASAEAAAAGDYVTDPRTVRGFGGGNGRPAGAWRRPRARPVPLMKALERRRSGLDRAWAREEGALRSQIWHALHCVYRAGSVSTKPTGHVTDIAFSPARHAPRLAAGSTIAPHEAVLYDLRKGTNSVLGKQMPTNMTPPAAHNSTVCCVRFSASGARLLTASYDRTVRVWDASDARLLWVLGEPDCL